MLNDLAARINQYYELNNQLNYFSNAQILSLLGNSHGEPHRSKTQILTLDGKKLFVKRLPVTDLDFENNFSTANLYQLPPYFNYNVGTLGINQFRELITHKRTTNWVLDGTKENFPLMYHYRIVPLSECNTTAIDEVELQRYLEYWNNDDSIKRYVIDRVNAKFEMVIFLEYIPNTLEDWIHENISQLGSILGKVKDIVDFLFSEGIIHFDVHFGNIMISDNILFLTDFGLTFDKNFDLTEQEHQFMASHSHFDYAEYHSSLINHLVVTYKSLSHDRKLRILDHFGLSKNTPHNEIMTVLLENLEDAGAAEVMNLSPEYIDIMLRYRCIISYMLSFSNELENDKRKGIVFENEKLKLLLQNAGVVDR